MERPFSSPFSSKNLLFFFFGIFTKIYPKICTLYRMHAQFAKTCQVIEDDLFKSTIKRIQVFATKKKEEEKTISFILLSIIIFRKYYCKIFLKIHLFYYHQLIHICRNHCNQLPIYYHYHCEIYAIYPRLDNQFVQRFEHAFVLRLAMRRALSPRDYLNAARRVSREPALSIYVENFTGRPFVSTSTRHDEMESRTDAVINGRARANPVRDVAR